VQISNQSLKNPDNLRWGVINRKAKFGRAGVAAPNRAPDPRLPPTKVPMRTNRQGAQLGLIAAWCLFRAPLLLQA
jgi:hypothetical protein